MANSRNSRSRNDIGGLQSGFERALREILARVSVSAPAIGIAYSGGLDSTILLRLAGGYALRHGLRIHAFHIHHGLSPNADEWLSHCEREARRCGIPFAARRVTVAADDGRGIEEAARVARYAALGDLCRQHEVPLLLTGHHQDDQAETVLLQLMRGAGLRGLSGMAQWQDGHPLLGGAIALGRPLLSMSRALLERAAQELKLAYVLDESNADTRYRRNALRSRIIPVMESDFPGLASRVARSALHIQSAQALLDDLAMIDLAACSAGGGHEALDLARLEELPIRRAGNLLRLWLSLQGLELPSTARLEEIRSQLFGGAPDTHPFFDFGNARLHRIGNRLELHPVLGTPPQEAIRLQWRGEQEIPVPQWRGRLIFERSGFGLDANRLRQGPLSLQPRSGRERLKIAANRPSKSLKNLFQESSIAPWQRQWLPLLYLDAELVFAAGLGMDVRRLDMHPAMDEGIAVSWKAGYSAIF
jgi:tRNA(Ile)-lysidine synthase